MRPRYLVAFALLLAACASVPDTQSMYEMGSAEYGPVPSADPSRLVSVQDCHKAITLDGGNLLCQ